LCDAPPGLGEHGVQRPRAACTAHPRYDAEGAAEGAAVWHLNDRRRSLQPRRGPHTAGRAELAGDALGGLLGALAHDRDAPTGVGERLVAETGRAARDDHLLRAASPRRAHRLPALLQGLAGDTAGVDAMPRPRLARLREAPGEQP